MIKRTPEYVKRWLAQLSFEEVVFWANLVKRQDWPSFEKFMFAEAERRKNIIWSLPEGDPVKLAIEKAALRGGIETLHSILMMAKRAPEELDRRAEGGKKHG